MREVCLPLILTQYNIITPLGEGRHHDVIIGSGAAVACTAGGRVGGGSRPRSGIHKASALHAVASRALRGAHLQHKGGPV